MATSVTSYVDVTDDRNAPSPKYYTSPNTWQDMIRLKWTNASSYYGKPNISIRWKNGNDGYYGTSSFRFNMPVKMSDTETTAAMMFSRTFNISDPDCLSFLGFNPSQVNYISFFGPDVFAEFNSEVIIGKNVTNCAYMFEYTKFDQEINIPQNVTDCSHMFYDCPFSHNISIPSGVTAVEEMFFHCSRFNKEVTFPSGITNARSLFSGCTNLNVNIMNVLDTDNKHKYVTDMWQTFGGCYNLNKELQTYNIGENVSNLYGTFYDCSNLHMHDVYIKNNDIKNLQSTFSGLGNNAPDNIYIGGINTYLASSWDAYKCRNMLAGKNDMKRCNIYYRGAAPFDLTVTWANNSILGKDISWTNSGNLCYNAQFGIYIYSYHSF